MMKQCQHMCRKFFKKYILAFLIRMCTCLMVLATLSIIGYIVLNGTRYLSFKLIFGPYTSENPSVLAPTVVTLIFVILVSLITFPLGVAVAIYQTEFAPKNNFFVKSFSSMIELLSGIPSILFGLFGSLFFGQMLGLGYSLISGVLTMAVMTLPMIISVTEESILAVDMDCRLGSIALGASRWYTVRKVVLPSAKTGIISGFLLSIGRVVGETAPLILTLGTAVHFPKNLLDSGRNLSMQMYVLSRDGGEESLNIAFVSALVLILLALGINLLAHALTKKSSLQN